MHDTMSLLRHQAWSGKMCVLFLGYLCTFHLDIISSFLEIDFRKYLLFYFLISI